MPGEGAIGGGGGWGRWVPRGGRCRYPNKGEEGVQGDAGWGWVIRLIVELAGEPLAHSWAAPSWSGVLLDCFPLQEKQDGDAVLWGHP